MARKYKVKAGTHVEDGTTYQTGEAVTSNRDLKTAFKEKFEDLGETSVAPVAKSSEPPTKTSESFGKSSHSRKGKGDWDTDKEA